MTSTDIWNYLVSQYKKDYNSQESVIQQKWEQYFSELFGYRSLFGEIDACPTVHIGSGKKAIPDIIIKNDRRNLFDVELKQYNLAFNIEMENQLKSYMDLLHISVGVLVCQKIYLYSYDYQKSELKKIEIEFCENNSDGIAFVELLQKERFSAEKAEELINSKNVFSDNVKKIKSAISEHLLKNLLEDHFKKDYNNSEIQAAMNDITLSVGGKITTPPTFKHEIVTPAVNVHGAKELFVRSVRKVLQEFDEQNKIKYDSASPNSYIRFQTKEMSEILPNMSKSGSWGIGAKYLFWLGEVKENRFKACFELGGWDIDGDTRAVMDRIIKVEKPQKSNSLEFRYKRIFTRSYEFNGVNVEEVVRTAIETLLSWQKQLLRKLK